MFEPLEFCCSLDTLSILFSFQFILSKTTDISKSVFWDSISVVAPTQMQDLRHGIVFFFFFFFFSMKYESLLGSETAREKKLFFSYEREYFS